MSWIEILLTGIALSMDAFAVSICKGLAISKNRKKNALIIALYFGAFQFGMPILGYLFGSIFQESIEQVDHWIAMFLLTYVGGNMIRESLSKAPVKAHNRIDFKTMIPLAIATSIDALAVGVTFSFLKVKIISSSITIGLITTTLSYIGVLLGAHFHSHQENKSKIIGGVLLIFLGIKILWEHLKGM